MGEQDNLFDIPDAPGDAIARQVATLFYSAADEYGYPPISHVQLSMGTAAFTLRAEDGHAYAVAITRVTNLTGDTRQ